MKMENIVTAVRNGLFVAAVMLLFMILHMDCFAYTSDDHPHAQFSPDGQAWTIVDELPQVSDYDWKYGKQNDFPFWYASDRVENTGLERKKMVVNTGQHIYSYDRMGLVPVYKWEIQHVTSACIHETGDIYFHDLATHVSKCYKAYWSGWIPKCADCGETIKKYNHYISAESIKTLQYINVDKAYYYVCPHNNHLEQGIPASPHTCKDVSFNRYKVVYKPNDMKVGGEMVPSYHMYDNATTYEGQPVVSNRYLSLNQYTRTGYVFAGWSEHPDGSGTVYADGQEILNLTEENYDDTSEEQGVVYLYAIWERSTSSLTVDAKDGIYEDGIGKREGNLTNYSDFPYGSKLVLKEENLTLPDGFTVSFDTHGGSKVNSITTKKKFNGWKKKNPDTFAGRFLENTYFFIGKNGSKDVIEAVYKNGSITLPSSEKGDSVIVGWYEDETYKKPAGMPGDVYTPIADVTLHAKWEQNLVLKAVTDLTIDNGKGGVDLSWKASDANGKVFKLYQKKETQGKEEYKQIVSADSLSEDLKIDRDFEYSGAVKQYEIPYSGFYDFTAYGAQGGNYTKGTELIKGGKGGQVTMRIWLEKGDILKIGVGSQSGYNGGGKSTESYGNGGGFTSVYSTNLKKYILIAGGGGGASPAGEGGSGGEETSLVESGSSGENNIAGGGGGYFGGTGGSYEVHEHLESCKHTHIGSATDGTGCYTLAITCGSTEFDKEDEEPYGYYRGDVADDGSHVWCIRCQSTETCQKPLEWPNCTAYLTNGKGHELCNSVYTCNVCGKTYTQQYRPSSCGHRKGYAANCGKDESYKCGYTQGEIIASNIAYGGSSFVCEEAISSDFKAGERDGDGSLTILSSELGYFATFSLLDVSANDIAAPEKVDLSSVKSKEDGKNTVKISFLKPQDNGTTYNHLCKSFAMADGKFVCESNETSNLITTGVSSYYYIYNTVADTQVNDGNKHGVIDVIDENGMSSMRLGIKVGEVKYLHLAAVDKAGNIGGTVHIMVEGEDIEWGVVTNPIGISSKVNGREYNSVYKKEDRTYFVKADGKTPFSLSFLSQLNGDAKDDYQVDRVSFHITSTLGKKQEFTTKAGHTSSLTAGNVGVQAAYLNKGATGKTLLKDALYTALTRSNYAVDTLYKQAFSIPKAVNGDILTIVPVAGAEYVADDGWRDVKYSEWSMDSLNYIKLIPDGEAPVIVGTELLENLDEYDRDKAVPIVLTSMDALSGVRDFQVVVQNVDNFSSKVYKPDATGRITITIDGNDVLYYGDIRITVTAIDNVGNLNEMEYGALNLGLKAGINKIHNDGKTTFKRGEGATLDITTTGYADRVEIIWPSEFSSVLPKDFDYTLNPEYAKIEKIAFTIPLGSSLNQYEVTVKAYKDGWVKEKKLLLMISGSILDDVRVRIR